MSHMRNRRRWGVVLVILCFLYLIALILMDM